MCGILCVLGCPDGGESRRGQVLERSRRQRHRGPDWTGIYAKGPHILAHERLAIVGCDSGAQPLYSQRHPLTTGVENKARPEDALIEHSIVEAVNGEIYNHKHLRAGLTAKKHVFSTNSDCEVILHGYQEQGVGQRASSDLSRGGVVSRHDPFMDFINRLNGIFAFVLVDETDGSWMVARDHTGICPLYIGQDATGAWWVASEFKALFDMCVWFGDFPPGYVYRSPTPGTTEIRRIEWYTPMWYNPEVMSTKAIDLGQLHTNLENAVKRQLMAEVPYGVLLSGGLDSSIIAAIAASHHVGLRAAGGDPGPLHSFSVGLKDSPDLKAARVVATYLKTVHHEFVFTIQEGLDALSDVIYHLETYDVTSIRAATPMYLMARKIRVLGVKMVLSGEGSDEIFGGYLYFHKCPNRAELQKELVRKLRILYKYDCNRANKAMAAWGVEARVPFLDREFLDYAMNEIDPSDKLCGRATITVEPSPKATHPEPVVSAPRIEKFILRKAFEGYLPDEILWRQKEQFSDGVGYGWIDAIKDHAATIVSAKDMKEASTRFPHNTPTTMEGYMIRAMFESHFPHKSAIEIVPGGPSVACSTAAAIAWDESFKTFADQSGRSVQGVHVAAYGATERGVLPLPTE